MTGIHLSAIAGKLTGTPFNTQLQQNDLSVFSSGMFFLLQLKFRKCILEVKTKPREGSSRIESELIELSWRRKEVLRKDFSILPVLRCTGIYLNELPRSGISVSCLRGALVDDRPKSYVAKKPSARNHPSGRICLPGMKLLSLAVSSRNCGMTCPSDRVWLRCTD